MSELNPYSIVAVAALLRQKDQDPVCVVRWALGASGNELPHTNDVFDVELLVEGDLVAKRSVSPLNYAMLDPVRIGLPYPAPGDTREWRVAQKPEGPIDPSATNDEDLTDDAIGVIHLLKPTSGPILRFRAARVLFEAFAEVITYEKSLQSLTEYELAESAILFAEALIRSNVRPLHLPQIAAEEYKSLMTGQPERSLLKIDAAPLRQLSHATLILHALTLPKVAFRLDEVIEQSLQVRNHIRFAALSGGEMIDYWCDPLNKGIPSNENNRGKSYPGSELMGLGCRIVIKASDIDRWISSKQDLVVRVSHQPRNFNVTDIARLATTQFAQLCEIYLEGDLVAFEPSNLFPIQYDRLKRAMLKGSSHPAQPPSGARIDWGMVRVEMEPLKKGTPTESTTSFRTGDAKVEIAIDMPPSVPFAPKDVRTNAAYNVYGVWEGVPGFDKYFSNPTINPCIEELRPWLLTRRYSFARDLRLAFPQIEGQDHPALIAAMMAPHWHPLLKRPDVIQDESDPEVTPLPDVSGDGDAIFTFDLRTGMAMPAPDRPPVGWDLAGPMAMAWTPEMDRDLQPFSAAPLRSQRYRFWVTSVDPFEQESDPIAVHTEDSDLGESQSFLFEPKRRTPLSPPPGGEHLSCTFDEGAKSLHVRFETPFDVQISGKNSTGGPQKRIDQTSIEAIVVIFRRLLLQEGKNRKLGPLAHNLPDIPQWQALARELEADRWRFFTMATVSQPTKEDQWALDFPPLAEDDLGWEYLAAVSFSVKPSHGGFWGKSALVASGRGRSLTLVKSGGSKPWPCELIDDMPSASAISKAKPCLVSDPKSPWSPNVQNVSVLRAKAIAAPSGIRRDIVLQRLLERNFTERGQPVQRKIWGEALLTEGQIAMSREALRRTCSLLNPPLPPESEELTSARRILARDFGQDALQPTATNGLRQHATVGFRGLAELKWKYIPRSNRPIGDHGKFSEAAAFRIYTTTIPTSSIDSENSATLVGDFSHISGNTYRFFPKKGGAEEFAAIICRPTAATLKGSDGIFVVTSVRQASEKGGAFIIELLPYSTGSFPKTGEARLFASQPLEDIPSRGVDETVDYRFLAPIPGGGEEWFAWWVSSVSAAGLESSPSQISPMAIELMPRTIEPPPPLALKVVPASDNRLHFLDPSNPDHAKWLPTSVSNIDDAKSFPRTVVTWRAPIVDEVEPLKIELQRIERQIAKPPHSFELNNAVKSAWEAIKTVESLPDNSPIDIEDLKAMMSWLGGSVVEVPDSPNDDYWVVFDPKELKPQMTVKGVIQIANDSQLLSDGGGAPEKLSAWVDYFGRNKDYDKAMDANWSYQYRLRTFVDMGSSLGNQRYLYSTATPWSANVVPETPAIKLSVTPAIVNEWAIPKARVRFEFHPRVTAFAKAARIGFYADINNWEYRIVVRRKLDLPPSLGENDQTWIDVGEPLKIVLGDPSPEKRDIIDNEVDRNWPGHAPNLLYQIFIQQFMIVNDSNGHVERLVRAFESGNGSPEIPVLLSAPLSIDREVEVCLELEIE
jgi:hypothetical protein